MGHQNLPSHLLLKSSNGWILGMLYNPSTQGAEQGEFNTTQ